MLRVDPLSACGSLQTITSMKPASNTRRSRITSSALMLLMLEIGSMCCQYEQHGRRPTARANSATRRQSSCHLLDAPSRPSTIRRLTRTNARGSVHHVVASSTRYRNFFISRNFPGIRHSHSIVAGGLLRTS